MTPITTGRPVDHGRPLPLLDPTWAALTMAAATVAIAGLLAMDQAMLAVPLLAALPAATVLLRHPVLAVTSWILLAQFVVQGDGGVERKVYRLVHRTMPLAAVALILLVQLVGPQRRTLPRLGWPELAMAGYLLASQLSILTHSSTPFATTMHLFDRVLAPMALYLVVRLVSPSRRHLGAMVAAMGAVVIIQAAIGFAAWTVPAALPPAWLGRAGQRTVGSLDHPNVYGTTMLVAALLLFHVATTVPLRRLVRLACVGTALLACFMVFMTFGRANWLAGLAVAIGLAVLHPRFAARIALVGSVAVLALVGSGLLEAQTEQAQRRFRSEQSEESALSRLPVVYASLRMFEAEPLTGWGYGDFDQYDQQFQRRVGDLYYPDKDHASHNLYLTILAEQGLVGLGLYLAPAAWWLARTIRRWRRLPTQGLASRYLVAALWLAALAHLVVNNFANMRIVYGLGLWWLILGLVASLVERSAPLEPDAPPIRNRELPASYTPVFASPVGGVW